MTAWAIMTVVIIPLALSEFSDVSPWLARRLLSRAAGLLGDPQQVARYREEWLAGLDDVPGQLTKLIKALSIACYSVPVIHWRIKAVAYRWPCRRVADALLALLSPRSSQARRDRLVSSYEVYIGRPGPDGTAVTVGMLSERIHVAIAAASKRVLLPKSQRVGGSGPFILELDHRQKRLYLHGLSRAQVEGPSGFNQPASSRRCPRS